MGKDLLYIAACQYQKVRELEPVHDLDIPREFAAIQFKISTLGEDNQRRVIASFEASYLKRPYYIQEINMDVRRVFTYSHKQWAISSSDFANPRDHKKPNTIYGNPYTQINYGDYIKPNNWDDAFEVYTDVVSLDEVCNGINE